MTAPDPLPAANEAPSAVTGRASVLRVGPGETRTKTLVIDQDRRPAAVVWEMSGVLNLNTDGCRNAVIQWTIRANKSEVAAGRMGHPTDTKSISALRLPRATDVVTVTFQRADDGFGPSDRCELVAGIKDFAVTPKRSGPTTSQVGHGSWAANHHRQLAAAATAISPVTRVSPPAPDRCSSGTSPALESDRQLGAASSHRHAGAQRGDLGHERDTSVSAERLDPLPVTIETTSPGPLAEHRCRRIGWLPCGGRGRYLDLWHRAPAAESPDPRRVWFGALHQCLRPWRSGGGSGQR